ncbi:MAG TPA: RNA-binding S4 domain-containing protein [Aliiroseovarius sp.]|nr:RNA-binding S4 domain-containing protein [Aliiroseovarius sp.]
MADLPEKMRADKWLFHARFFKTRALAAKMIAGGHFRVNSRKSLKPAQSIRAGDTLTFIQARNVRVVAVVDLSTRRGPAPEAQALYDDQSPAPPIAQPAPGHDKGGRPSRKDRRNQARFDARTLE